MKRLLLSVVAAVLVFALSACGGGQQTQPNTNQPATETPSTEAPSTAPSGSYDAATAEALYKNTCAGCHGQTLEGAVGPNLQKVGGTMSKDQILEVLKNGKGSMPPGLAKGDDAETLAAWLADKK
ncbi:cytochrome c551 [Brevibacillus invocatus]|uniref:cytochrome c551 n=1 Tax=Brevibacillus invocatus TaxID=173959 RepID=UPI002041E4A7|nr:cytochrome c [Brevibacillus invocatus]MCM3079687.1 cytochrome c [Brevibacillus invocatus]MCM3431512.1 cytochrome c [Brevibacillus invocatus]